MKIDNLEVVQNIEEVINLLQQGISVARWEYGDSMEPIFNSGEYAILTPISSIDEICCGDAVFCQVDGSWMTHIVWMKNKDTNQCLIGSTHGQLYGWTDIILAKATRTSNRTTHPHEE